MVMVVGMWERVMEYIEILQEGEEGVGAEGCGRSRDLLKVAWFCVEVVCFVGWGWLVWSVVWLVRESASTLGEEFAMYHSKSIGIFENALFLVFFSCDSV
jgi:hypothetical protein